jgi:hypothetical protein
VADESVTESGTDQIVCEDKQQSQTDNGKEEFAPATETVEPGPVIIESSRRRRFLFSISLSMLIYRIRILHMEILVICRFLKLQLKSIIFFLQ